MRFCFIAWLCFFGKKFCGANVRCGKFMVAWIFCLVLFAKRDFLWSCSLAFTKIDFPEWFIYYASILGRQKYPFGCGQLQWMVHTCVENIVWVSSRAILCKAVGTRLLLLVRTVGNGRYFLSQLIRKKQTFLAHGKESITSGWWRATLDEERHWLANVPSRAFPFVLFCLFFFREEKVFSLSTSFIWASCSDYPLAVCWGKKRQVQEFPFRHFYTCRRCQWRIMKGSWCLRDLENLWTFFEN